MDLKLLRKKKGLTQADLAKPLGLTRQMISAFERRTSIPDLLQAKILAQTLDVSVDEIAALFEEAI